MKKILSISILLLLGSLLIAFQCMIEFDVFDIDKEVDIHRNSSHVSSNGKYIGVIDEVERKAHIFDCEGTELSSLAFKREDPAQIAVGESSYFLLYLFEDSEEAAGRIVQYGYDSKKIEECEVSNIQTITCLQGCLIIGDCDYAKKDSDAIFSPYYYGYCMGERYVAEEEFGSGFERLKPDSEEKCKLGDVELYYHPEGYFSVNPIWSDYEGESHSIYDGSDYVYDELEEEGQGKREKKNFDLLIKHIRNVKRNGSYDVYEYQKDSDIYGICNVLRSSMMYHHMAERVAVQKSYFYKINQKNKDISILEQKEDCLAIALSDSVCIYQKDNEIIRQNLETGEKRILYAYDEMYNQDLHVGREYLFIRDGEKRLVIKWDL